MLSLNVVLLNSPFKEKVTSPTEEKKSKNALLNARSMHASYISPQARISKKVSLKKGFVETIVDFLNQTNLSSTCYNILRIVTGYFL